MIIKFSFIRLSIIFLLVIFFPLAQNQWLNLYLFDTNNFSYYKYLYFLSGLICPFLVSLNSINKFTYYKFNNNYINRSYIKGKTLLIAIFISLFALSTLITNYIFLNFEFFYKILIANKYNFTIDISRHILIIVIISIFLIFRKTRPYLKKFLLLNFFMISIFIWYLQLKNVLIDNTYLITNYLKIENINIINILAILVIELFYYLWSYISYGSNLSDWKAPVISKSDFTNILRIVVFYLFIILYYSILEN